MEPQFLDPADYESLNNFWTVEDEKFQGSAQRNSRSKSRLATSLPVWNAPNGQNQHSAITIYWKLLVTHNQLEIKVASLLNDR